ncbi:MAG: TonB-dependent receptor plug domain-containing protein, partial [bacterium]
PVHTVSEALYYSPGVHMNPRGGTGQTVLPSIYGAPHRNVLVLVDGVPINDQAEGFGDVAQIPSENVEKIEIVKGAGSSQWGSSIGGVINIITKNPQDQDQKFGGDVTLGYGRWNTQDFRFSLNGNINGFGYVLSGSRLASEDFSDGSGVKLDRSDSDTFKGFAKIITPKWRNTQMTFSYLQTDAEVGMFENPVFGLWWNGDTKMKVGRANLVYQPHEKLDIDVNFEFNNRDGVVRQFLLENDQFFGNLTLDETTWNVKGKLGTSLLPSNRLIAGVDFLTSDFSFGRIFGPIASGPDDYDLRETALYFNDQHTFGNLSVTVGARFDDNSEFGSHFSPSFGAVVNSNQIRTLARVSISRVFDPPTLLFRYMDSNPALGTTGNPELKAEKAWAYNVGIESHYLDFLWTKITAFKLDMEDLIGFEVITDSNDVNFGLRKAVNIGEARRQGVEIELGLEFPFGLSLLGAATLIEAKDLITDQTIKGIPTQTFDLGLTYINSGFTLNVKGRYVNQNEDPELGQIPGFVINDKALLWDAKISYLYKLRSYKLTSYVSLHNITSKKLGVEPFYHVPGRWLEGGIKFGF